ncbi:MAG: ATP-dependent helicase C-terminal domain-containing protein [Planctomycetota bacterium]|jgi:ATP-dependent helicase HrpB
MLADRIASGEIPLPSWGPAADAWIERVRCVAAWCPERDLPTFDEPQLAAVRRNLAVGATRAKDLAGVDPMAALVGALEAGDAEFVRRMTPERVTLPSGFRLKIAYAAGDPPRGRARIQDLIGCERSPTVAGGRVPVLVEILAPNQRPVQVTADLASFWRDLYPSIRNALARRYPRHRWP